jgi:hypothetical protein
VTLIMKRSSLARSLVVLASVLLLSTSAWAVDADLDGVDDSVDNCPLIANVDQADANHNGIGDACEAVSAIVPSWGSLKSWYR